MISIIIPMEREGILALWSGLPCLNSLLGQSYGDFEVILAIPFYSPLCRIAAARLSRQDPRIRAVYSKKPERSELVREGIAAAKGEWICMAEARARFQPGSLELFSHRAAEGNADILFHDIHNFRREHACLSDAIVRTSYLEGAADDIGCDGSLAVEAALGAGARAVFFEEALHILPEHDGNQLTDSLSIHGADHCNLNCAYCSHYSPTSKKCFADLCELEHDLNVLPPMRQIGIVGGEPLLHPQISELIRLVAACQPKASLYLVTNGLLLPSMGEDFHAAVRDCKVAIHVTRYPNDDEAYRKHLKKIEASVEQLGADFWNPEDFIRMPLDPEGGQDPTLSFLRCATHFPQLHDGKIFPCSPSAYAFILNERFGTSFSHEEGDWLDVGEVGSIEHLHKWLRTPKHFCRYCKVCAYERVPWRRSRLDASEWLD